MQTDPSKLPEVQQATATAQKLVELAGNYQVTSPAQYSAAGADLVQVNGAIARLDELRLTMTRPIDQAKKAVMDFFRGPSERLETAKSQIKRAMLAYDQEQERIRKEAQRQAEEAARKERERLEALAREAQRVADEKAAEARRQADMERKAAEEAQRVAEAARIAGNAAAAEAAQKLAQEAARAANNFDRKAAATEARAEQRVETLQATAAAVVAPVIPREVPKAAGVQMRRAWKHRIKDVNKLPREYMTPDEKKIGAVVRALKKDAEATIPGIEVWDEPDLAAARGAA